MTSRRILKAQEAIREVVSMAILTEIRDPRVRDVTVVKVEMAPDMRQAKIMVSVMGDEQREKLSLLGLQNSAGFLQKRIADEIDTRYTPKLVFEIDRGVKNSLEVLRILKEVLPSTSSMAPGASPAPPAPASQADDEYEEDEYEDDDSDESDEDESDDETSDDDEGDDELEDDDDADDSDSEK